MLQIREFQDEDAEIIATWFQDEVTFYRWCAGRLPHFPMQPQDLVARYAESRQNLGGQFLPIVAYDETGLAGQMFLRLMDAEQGIVRMGFVAVDAAKRGKGYGKEMLRLALEYASEHWHAKKATLGVFENNPNAYHCYRAVGFTEDGGHHVCELMGEQWGCIEMEYIFEEKS